jgi:hypothetical protein
MPAIHPAVVDGLIDYNSAAWRPIIRCHHISRNDLTVSTAVTNLQHVVKFMHGTQSAANEKKVSQGNL